MTAIPSSHRTLRDKAAQRPVIQTLEISFMTITDEHAKDQVANQEE